MLGRPCAFLTTSSELKPCSRAQPAQTRATAGVESTNTPSRSKSIPRQRMLLMIHDRQKTENRETSCAAAVSLAPIAGCKRWMSPSRRETEWKGREVAQVDLV